MLPTEQIQAAIAAIESSDPHVMKAVLTHRLVTLATAESPGESEREPKPTTDVPAPRHRVGPTEAVTQ